MDFVSTPECSTTSFLELLRCRELQQERQCMTTDGAYIDCFKILGVYLISLSKLFGLSQRTLCLAHSLMNRILLGPDWSTLLRKPFFQLVALVCVSIAAKATEAHGTHPNLRDLSDASHYSRAQIVLMERLLLQTLRWEVNDVTPMSYLTYYLQHSTLGAPPLDNAVAELVYLLVNFIIQDPIFLRFLPSVLAAAVLKVSHDIVGQLSGQVFIWGPAMVTLTGYPLADVNECCLLLQGRYYVSNPPIRTLRPPRANMPFDD